jgi:hypothetical protein
MGKIVKYKMELEVLTPVHIGGVDYKTKLDKKEYLFNPNTNDLTIIDNAKFSEILIKKNLFDKYIGYIEENGNITKNKNIKLLSFLKENNIYNDLKYFTKKEYKNLDIDSKNKRTNDIKLLNRNIYDEVYIQGSSVKGALVNLLIVDYIINNREEFLDEKKKILDLAYSSVDEQSIKRFKDDVKKIVKNIEKKIFYNENKNFEKMKKFGISISDSYRNHEEIKTNFYQDIDEKRKDGKEACMPIIRECIMPKNKFDFDITLDFEVLDESKLEIRNYDDLISALENAVDYLIDNTLGVENGKNQNLILGANTGFHQKTIVHALFSDKKERLEVTKKLLHKSKKNVILNHLNDRFSPRIINRVRKNGKLELAGLVRIQKIGDGKNVGTD